MKDQSFDPKIKKISIIIIALFISLVLCELILNLPLQNALNFGSDHDAFIEMLGKAVELERSDDNNTDMVYKFMFNIVTASHWAMEKLNEDSKDLFPLISIEINLKISLLILVLIIISIALKESIKDLMTFKWIMFFSIMIVGVLYSYLVPPTEYFVFFLALIGVLLFNFIAFYNSSKLIYWLIVPLIVAIFVTYPSLRNGLLYTYFLRVTLPSGIYYVIQLLKSATSFILPSIAFYFFLKEIIYEKSFAEVTIDSAQDSSTNSNLRSNKIKNKSISDRMT